MDELLTLCAETCEAISQRPFLGPLYEQLRKDTRLHEQIEAIDRRLSTWVEVHRPATLSNSIHSGSNVKAVAWNIERGKNLEAILEVLQSHPELSHADLFFLTEVDWGMARSQNLNVTEELAKALGLHAYFAPSYYNLTTPFLKKRSRGPISGPAWKGHPFPLSPSRSSHCAPPNTTEARSKNPESAKRALMAI
jgi:hypothetical protein